MFTFVIQGPLTKETYDFYTDRYTDIPLIFSTWNTENINDLIPKPNATIIQQPCPDELGNQNVYRQTVSTIQGLNLATTPFTIKLRGDEFYSNLESIMNLCKQMNNKIITLPVFFRIWSWAPFHISDHLLAGSTELLKKMFYTAKINCENKTYMENSPEVVLARSLLDCLYMGKYGKQEFIDHFYIADLNQLKPYKIVSKGNRSGWSDNFDPIQQSSISTMNEL